MPDELSQRAVRLQRVSQRRLEVDLVAVASSLLGLGQNAALFQFAEDTKNGSLGDPYLDRQLLNENLGLSEESDDDVGVIRQERPSEGRRRVRATFLRGATPPPTQCC